MALVVDEWGTWYAPLPGTNPGFLQQQNSLRDALVASLNFDIFSQHAARVRMANIAQMVNVLQAMILTDGDKMVLTPTYHVFAMYKPYQDATHLPLQLQTPEYRHGDTHVPAVHGSAVKAKDGHVYIALTNLDTTAAATVSVQVDGLTLRAVEGQILTAPAITTHNTYAQPRAVAPAVFKGARVQGQGIERGAAGAFDRDAQAAVNDRVRGLRQAHVRRTSGEWRVSRSQQCGGRAKFGAF